jgi:hypothetical protein
VTTTSTTTTTTSTTDDARRTTESDAAAGVSGDPHTMPLPVVRNDVTFVFQDGAQFSSSASMAHAALAAPVSALLAAPTSSVVAAGVSIAPVDALGTVLGSADAAVADVWAALEARMLRVARGSAGDVERLARGSRLRELWLSGGAFCCVGVCVTRMRFVTQKGANLATGVLRPISVINETMLVTASVVNPLDIPLQLSNGNGSCARVLRAR